MKRVGIWFLVTLLFCIPILRQPAAVGLFKDTDTAEIIRQIRVRNNPFSWFKGDWPLQNHFYRPVSTLSFELDNKLYGDEESGYARTNRIICCVCLLLLFWLVVEISGSPGLGTLACFIFTHWQFDRGEDLGEVLLFATVAVAIVGAIRHKGAVSGWLWVLVVGGLTYQELIGIAHLTSRTLNWLPGRTATVMTIFCLASMAAFARYLRLESLRADAAPTSTDVPATKSSRATEQTGEGMLWLILSTICCWLALSSYEQAVMLPGCLAGVAVIFAMRRYKVNWWSVGASFATLAVYMVLRKILLPTGLSGYQSQQLRFGWSVVFALLDYVFIAQGQLRFLFTSLTGGLGILFNSAPYAQAGLTAANVFGYIQLRRKLAFTLGGLVLSFLAFLPMAFSKPFEHYHYWPMALRSLFVAALLWIWWELVVIAVSRPALQAPPRPYPAPGSLPHP